MAFPTHRATWRSDPGIQPYKLRSGFRIIIGLWRMSDVCPTLTSAPRF